MWEMQLCQSWMKGLEFWEDQENSQLYSNELIEFLEQYMNFEEHIMTHVIYKQSQFSVVET